MDATYNMPQSQNSSQTRILEVNFSWRKHTIVIAEPTDSTTPLYLGKYNPWTMKTIFKTGPSVAKTLASDSDVDSINLEAEDSDVIGDSKVKAFHIDCETHIRGRPVRLSAAKRILTRYNYPSLAYSKGDGKPAVMTWRCNKVVKCFDFELLDPDENVVARFNPKYLGVRKVASIEMLGDRAWKNDATEEVLITGLTLYLCMIYRASSPVPLVGALVSRPGKDYKVTEKEVREEEERRLKAQASGHLQPTGSTLDPKDVWVKVNEGAGDMDKETS